MNSPLSPAAKKAYEVGYALFRVAAIVPQKALAEALRQEGLHLLWNSIRDSKTEAASGVQALYYLVSFGRDTGSIHPENAELLIRQLEGLSFLLAASFQDSQAVRGPADLSGIFAGASPAAPIADLFSKPSPVKSKARPEIALGPAQKERQAMILDKIRQSGNCRTSELQAVLPDLSERTLRYDLQRLVEQGKIERGGAGPASWYRLRNATAIDGNVQTGFVAERNVSQKVSL